MAVPQPDTRSEQRKLLDEQIAAEEEKLGVPVVPVGSISRPMEDFLRRKQPVAVLGIVENGLVRPLDGQVKLPEQSRVIIVASSLA